MTSRKRVQQVLDQPSLIAALHIYRKHYAGDGLITRKSTNQEATGASEVTTERHTEKASHKDMAGLERPHAGEHPLYTPDNRHDRKPCSRCKISKLMKHFTKIKKRNGLVIHHSWCDSCRAEYAQQVYYDAKILKNAP